MYGWFDCHLLDWGVFSHGISIQFEPPHDKTNKITVYPVLSESSLSAWRKLGPFATHWSHSEDSDQTGRMPRLIWVFAGRTVILLVLSWGGTNWNVSHDIRQLNALYLFSDHEAATIIALLHLKSDCRCSRQNIREQTIQLEKKMNVRW